MPNILPSNILTIPVNLRVRGECVTATVTLPPHFIRRNNLVDKEIIVLCYIGRADENPDDSQKIVKQ
jgi:hypothetical protein